MTSSNHAASRPDSVRSWIDRHLDSAVSWVVAAVFDWDPSLPAWLREQLPHWFAGIARQYVERALRCRLEDNDFESAAAHYRKAILWQPYDAELHSALGQLYYEQGLLEEAEKLFREALDNDYWDLRALKGLGDVLLEQGNLLDAMYFYLKYLEQRPRDASVCHNLGVVFHHMANFEKAIEYYGRAEQESPDDLVIQKNHALALFALGRYEDAQSLLLDAGRIDPHDAEVDLLLGAALENDGKAVPAWDRYEAAMRKSPDNPEPHLHLSRLAPAVERFRDGVEHAKAAVDLFLRADNGPGAANAYWELGGLHYSLGEWDNSIAACTEALKLNPDLAAVHFNLGLTLLQLGRGADARREYEEGLAKLDHQIIDLKAYAIDDLRDALGRNPGLADGAKILAMLEDKYTALTKRLTRSVKQPAA